MIRKIFELLLSPTPPEIKAQPEATGAIPPPLPKQINYDPYRLQTGLLTQTESLFFPALLDASMSHGLMPFPKVRVEDIITVDPAKTANRKEHWGLRSRIKPRHFDFILCSTAAELQPLIAVELDDPSHNSAKAKEDDHFKDSLCMSVDLAMLRIPVSTEYDTQELALRIAQLCKK